MENFLVTFIRQKLFIVVIFACCLLGGILAALKLPVDAFPDLSNNQVQVLTATGGMAPLETEELVTIPLETMMNGLPGVKQIRSISKFGVSLITVVFDDKTDVYFARQLVNERIQSVKNRLPHGVEPELGPITTAMGEIYQYILSGNGYSPMQLKTLQDWEVKYRLRAVPGVNEVNTWGGETKEYVVTIYPARLQQYGLTLADAFAALRDNNDNFSGGIIDHTTEQYIVRGIGRYTNTGDIGNVIVQRKNGVPIFIRNIADVHIQPALRQGAVTQDGKGEVVSGIVMMLKGENSRNVIEHVKAKIKTIAHNLPESVQIHPFYDQEELVNQTLHTVQSNLVEGGMLVMGVLLFMLGNIRAALIVTLTIPLSLMFSFMGMEALGISANIMSLGALDFGMIVDGSIVMVENTLSRLAHSKENHVPETTMQIIQESLREMARPIIFGVLIITVVYLPILSLEGMEYRMFSPMVFTVTFALLGSLLIALLLVPVLCSWLLRGRVQEKESILIRKLRPVYTRFLSQALDRPKVILSIAISCFVLAVGSLPFMGTEFVPKLDEGSFMLNTRKLPSISLQESIRETQKIERLVKSFPEVKTIVSRIGRADLATDPMSVYESDAYIMLKPHSQWRSGITKDSLREAITEKLKQHVTGTTFSFSQPIEQRVNELVSGVRADVAIKLFGENIDTLVEKAAEIESVVQGIRGQTDLQVEKLKGGGQLLIVPNRELMARYGVNMADIRRVTETAIVGHQASEVIKGRRRFTLRVKFPEGDRIDPRQVGNLLIETTQGRVPISQVAKIQIGEGLELVNREMGQRRIIIQLNVQHRDVGSFVKEAQEKIAEKVTLPQGYTIEWGGQFENQQRAMSRLMIVVPASILIIFLLLMATFSSIKNALLVMANVPFALIGGIIALWLRGMYLNVPGAIGFIALFGVAILNGLVLVSTINKCLADVNDTPENLYSGLLFRQAIIHGAEMRLRPVLMTALVAILGFMPMAVSHGSGAEVQKPLATVVIGGIFSATFLTLVVLPVIYNWVHSPRNRIPPSDGVQSKSVFQASELSLSST